MVFGQADSSQSGGYERVHFGAEPVYSEVLEAWVIAEGRSLFIADDREGEQRWLDDTERDRADAEQERGARQAVERELEVLKARVTRGPE